mmetsp:Transcript_39941/g.90120  ORF Transcript_39941/g.90120 Transcript_39941/m.90120 type:complete len:294 (+) Transcript_39941:50-931(+)
MIDAYDVLNVNVDADAEAIKKSYRRLSLQHHPDKAGANGSSGDASRRFKEIKEAYDIVQDPSRRKAYDAFGIDLGPEPLHRSMWDIGLNSLVWPFGTITVKTFVVLVMRWAIGIRLVKVALLGVAGFALLLYCNGASLCFSIRGCTVRGPVSVVIHLGGAVLLAVAHHLLPFLFDAICLVYLVSEAFGIEGLPYSRQVLSAVGIGALGVSWLLQRWWIRLFMLQVAILGICVLACHMASEVLVRYVDCVEARRAEEVRSWRLLLRRERERLGDEAAMLRERLRERPLADPRPR